MRCFAHLLAVHFLLAGACLAEPTPEEVANTVSNLWSSQEFDQLGSYITNLYASFTNYVPSLLAASFHDSTYLGMLSGSTAKLARVASAVNANTNDYTFEFRELLTELVDMTAREIALHARMGTSNAALQSNASPQAVYSAWDGLTLPQINILFYAPATNAP